MMITWKGEVDHRDRSFHRTTMDLLALLTVHMLQNMHVHKLSTHRRHGHFYVRRLYAEDPVTGGWVGQNRLLRFLPSPICSTLFDCMKRAVSL